MPATQSAVSASAPAENPPNTFFSGIADRGTLLGDMSGLRPFLSKYGLSLSVSEVSEVFGNVTGGIHQGADYDGVTTLALQVDTQQANLYQGGTFNVSALQIHGRNLSTDNLLSLQTASGDEGDRSTRLWELWYQQKFFGDDLLDVKVGQQSLDQEFIVSQNAAIFANTMFGWPVLPTYDLPGGGPAYPLSSLGVRARLQATGAITFLTGVFSGTPARGNRGDPQMNNATGTQFPLGTGPLIITELQYTNSSPDAAATPDSGPLPGVYKLGFWYDWQEAPPHQIDQEGLPLAGPLSGPPTNDPTYAFYASVDQMAWRSAADPSRTVSVFLRAMGTPQQAGNLISIAVNGGLTVRAPFPARPNDTFGVGFGYARASNGAREADQDLNRSGNAFPVRSDETCLEATYQYQVTPWCVLQPDFQYVFNPGASVFNPRTVNSSVKNEAVIGFRATIVF